MLLQYISESVMQQILQNLEHKSPVTRDFADVMFIFCYSLTTFIFLFCPQMKRADLTQEMMINFQSQPQHN